jgi:hypothetical protein
MPSRSLTEWETTAARTLDDVERVHRAVSETGRGKGYATRQIKHTYAILLAGRFQRFCRGLHSEAIDHLVGSVDAPAVRAVLRANLVWGRQLDGRNAQPGSIGADFGRLGLEIWEQMYGQDRRNLSRRMALELMNRWRNAIAHQDFADRQLPTTTLRLADIRRWRRACSALARSLDAVVHKHVTTLVGTSPWC